MDKVQKLSDSEFLTNFVLACTRERSDIRAGTAGLRSGDNRLHYIDDGGRSCLAVSFKIAKG
jgi:hypothetical protein